jgi:hypothetical protein
VLIALIAARMRSAALICVVSEPASCDTVYAESLDTYQVVLLNKTDKNTSMIHTQAASSMIQTKAA